MPSKAAKGITGSLSVIALGLANPSLSHAAAITITPTFESSITNDPNSAAIQAGINAAIAEIQSKVQTATATPLNVSIKFTSVSTGLGSSSQPIYYGVAYQDYRDALAARSTSANDMLALSNLPDADNFNGFAGMALTAPHLRALGLYNAADNAEIGINTSLTNLSRSGPQNPSLYDLQTVAMHEIDEILGVGGPATSIGASYGGSNLGSLDPFRYKAPGTFTHSATDTAYFSIDGGNTNIVTFNKVSGADYADYATNSTHYVQDAFGTPGTYRDLSTPELTSYDVIGYTVAVPEPACLAVVGMGTLVAIRRRRVRSGN